MKKKEKLFKKIFLIAAIYDLVLGIAFFLFYKPVYNYFGIDFPVYPMYLQLSAAFVLAMGVGYFFVFLNMYRNVDLVKLGVVYKIVYSSVAGYFFFAGVAHAVFFLFAIFDIIFIILFIQFLQYAKNEGKYLKWK